MSDIERRDAALEVGFVVGKLTRDAAVYGILAGVGATALKLGRLIPDGCVLAAIGIGGVVGTIIGSNDVGARLRGQVDRAKNASNTVGR